MQVTLSEEVSFLRGGNGGGLSGSSLINWCKLPHDTDWNSVKEKNNNSLIVWPDLNIYMQNLWQKINEIMQHDLLRFSVDIKIGFNA